MIKDCYAITVYRDAVEKHDCNDNLIEIVVEKQDLIEWLNTGKPIFNNLEEFFDPVDGYTADDTLGLVSFLESKGKDILVLR